MKILLVNKYHYVKGGSETYYFGLADLLTKLGHEVIYFSMADSNNKPCEQEKYFVSNVDFNSNISTLQKVKAGFRVLYSFEAKKNISALIEQEHPDIVHINLVHRHITLSIVRAIKKYNIPIVFTIHDLNCVCPNHEMLVNGHVCEKCLHGRYSNCIKNKCVKGSTAKSTLAAIEATNYKRMKIYDDIDLYITPSYFYKKKLEAKKKKKAATTTTTTTTQAAQDNNSTTKHETTAEATTKAEDDSKLKMTYPVPSQTKITCGYGSAGYAGHTGVDFSCPAGSAVVAAESGIVIISKDLTNSDGSYRSYGRYIVIMHDKTDSAGNYVYTLYAHNKSRLVSEGQYVSKGQQIAWSGSTGNSTGPHCHFEVRTPTAEYSNCVNPTYYLP